MRRKFIIVTLISSFALAGCGIKGNLKTPPPLWGKGEVTQPAEQTSEQPVETPTSDPFNDFDELNDFEEDSLP